MANIMSVRAPDTLQEKLRKLAQKQGLTRNALILQILWNWVGENEKPDSETLKIRR